jgi:hypothetical protein
MFANHLHSDTEHPKDFNLQKIMSFMECKGLFTAHIKQKFSTIPLFSSSSESDISSSDSPESEIASGSDWSLPVPASSS